MAEAADTGGPPSLQVDGAVATITLRRPAVANRLSLDDLQTFAAHLATVEAQSTVTVLCLQGQGRHFCSGFHLGQAHVGMDEAARRFEAVANALERARPLTVLALQGGAFGGGADLAVACDFRVGCSKSELRIPAARLGLHFYRGGMERLVHRLGLPAARRILLAAEHLNAQALNELGLIDRHAGAPEAVPAAVQAFSRELAALAPLAVLPMKQHLNRIARGQLDLDQLAADIARANASQDLQEGTRAWEEGREPVFRGH